VRNALWGPTEAMLIHNSHTVRVCFGEKPLFPSEIVRNVPFFFLGRSWYVERPLRTVGFGLCPEHIGRPSAEKRRAARQPMLFLWEGAKFKFQIPAAYLGCIWDPKSYGDSDAP